MAETDLYFGSDDLHPIDLVESIAASHDWEFDRIAEDQIAMAVQGQWRTYAITLAWSGGDEILRLICTFEMEPPAARLPQVLDLLNRINDACWTGCFTWWADQRLMVYRYGLVLTGDQMAGPDQVDTMIRAAVSSCERFYPAFQLVTWGGRAPEDAIQIAMTEAYGRA